MVKTEENGVIFEFTKVGNMLRVCAVDVATGIEVVLPGYLHANPNDLKKIAYRKLLYVMKKQKANSNSGDKPKSDKKLNKLI